MDCKVGLKLDISFTVLKQENQRNAKRFQSHNTLEQRWDRAGKTLNLHARVGHACVEGQKGRFEHFKNLFVRTKMLAAKTTEKQHKD